MIIFRAFTGILAAVDNFWTESAEQAGCSQLMSLRDENGDIVNFVVTPETYFVDQAMVSIGDRVTGFYDAGAPVPLIFPPQYRALVMVRIVPDQNVKADYFNDRLVSSDGTLRLNIAPWTGIVLENGQRFMGSLANRNLIVVYRAATYSIPAITTPDRVIVMC